MNSHKNALSTQRGREHLVMEVERIGLKRAAAQAGMSPRAAPASGIDGIKPVMTWLTAVRARTEAPGAARPTRSSAPRRCARTNG